MEAPEKRTSRKETGVVKVKAAEENSGKKMVKVLPWQQRKVHVRQGWKITSERKGKARLWKNGFIS